MKHILAVAVAVAVMGGPRFAAAAAGARPALQWHCGPNARIAARIYSLKIWRDGELVRHYVPVIADNGGPYLFDKVTRTFHQGATSGLWDVGEVGERIPQGMSIVIR